MNPTNPPIVSGPDLTDPAVLARTARELADGLEMQAVASRAGSAMGGAPFPDQFFGRCAQVFRILADLVSPLPVPVNQPPAAPKQTMVSVAPETNRWGDGTTAPDAPAKKGGK